MATFKCVYCRGAKVTIVPDSFLRIIPKDPNYVPVRAYQDQLCRLFKSLLTYAEEISYRTTAEIEFIDCGDQVSEAYCPNCGKKADLDWWTKQVDNAYQEGHFSNLGIEMSCCGLSTTLNALRYEAPVGWARFVLEARNPRDDLTDEQMETMQHVSGVPLTKIVAR